LAELAEGLTEVEVAGDVLLLVRRGDAVTACAALCPHKFTALAGGTLEDGCLTCPQHEASFDLGTGKPRPGQEWAGMLPLHAVRIHEGVVQIQL
jgi:nitrite reductase/ring-hydroxylating ferredoxin subunit